MQVRAEPGPLSIKAAKDTLGLRTVRQEVCLKRLSVVKKWRNNVFINRLFMKQRKG
jgi:hypothetical protein